MKSYRLSFTKLLTFSLSAVFLCLTACTNSNHISSSDSSSGSQKAQKSSEHHFDAGKTLDVQTIEGSHYIAIAAPLTGPYKELGKTILEGANLAVEEFNSNHGDYKKVGTVIIDDGGIVSEGVARADLVIESKVLGVIGHLNSEISIETARKYSKAKLPMISPASTHPKFTEIPSVKGYVFRTIGTDRQLGKEAAKYVAKNDDFKRVAVLYNDRAYGISVANEFVRELSHQSKEKEVVFYETIPVRTDDHSITAQKVIDKDADLVFFIGEYNDAGFLVKDLKNLKPEIQFLAAEGVHNTEFIDIAGTQAEGTLVIGAKSAPEEIDTRYFDRYKKQSSAYVGTSYLATKILLEAVEKNNFNDPDEIAKTIKENDIFDPNGDLIDPDFVFYTVQDSKFVEAG